MGGKLIYGIQQIGIGVKNAEIAFKWYAQNLGADALIFDDRMKLHIWQNIWVEKQGVKEHCWL